MTQLEAIISHVKRHGGIDSWTAIRVYGITRLAARVFELKNSDNAMKAIRSSRLPKGFVLYVPDVEERVNSLKKQLIDYVIADPHATPEDVADFCLHIAVKANTIKAA